MALDSQDIAYGAPFLAGGGEMGELMRAKDWSATKLGATDRWPQSLRTSVSICLNSQFAMLVWWGQDLLMLYNDAYSKIIGDKHPDALGDPGWECFPDIWHIVGPMLLGVMETGQATWSEDLLLMLKRHGYREECYFTFSYSPIRDESGQIGGIFTPVAETTNKVIGERRLRTLRDLAAGSTEVKSVEEACAAIISTLSENPYDVPFALLYLLDDEASTARLAGASGIEPGLTESPATIDLSQTDKCNSWPLARPALSGETVLLENIGGEAPGLPSGVWDEPSDHALVLPVTLPGHAQPTALLVAGVSPRKRLDPEYRTFFDLVAKQVSASLAEVLAYEEERRRAEALADLNRAKTTFFSNISHEFRTPLTLILGPVEDGLAQGDRQADQEVLQAIHRNSLRLLRLVNTLLDFSRLEENRMVAHYLPTDLCTLTSELASAFRSAVETAGLHLRVECEEFAEPVYVDRDMWEKIVLNLMSNAFKFTREGEIEVKLVRADGSAKLTVRDTGIGIESSEIPRLFERFHRVEGAQGRTHEGTGIGLALVKELVALHGGEAAVESTPGQGSTFSVTIPLGTDHLPADRLGQATQERPVSRHAPSFVMEAQRWLPSDTSNSAPLPADSASATPGQNGRTRILLADDNADMRAYVSRILRSEYEVEVVEDGQAALEAILRSLPDLLLSDVMMPRMDGITLLRTLRANPRTGSLPAILLSARAGEEAGVEGLQAGADDYLIKPFSARELMARVAAQLRMARVRDEARAVLRAAYDHERRIATTFQNALFAIPPEDAFEGLTLAGLYESAWEEAEVGGDFIDAFAIPNDRVAIAVGDVSGKGLAAAARTAEIRYALRAFLRDGASPAEAMSRVNNVLYDAQALDKTPYEGFACLALAVLHPETGQATFLSAGAEPPMIVRSSGHAEEIRIVGTPLAVARDAPYEEAQRELASGDIIALVTDGITEARFEKEFFGYDRLLKAAETGSREDSVAKMAHSILAEAKAFGGRLRDDACVLLARRA